MEDPAWGTQCDVICYQKRRISVDMIYKDEAFSVLADMMHHPILNHT